MSTFEKNKDLPQIKALSQIELKAYKNIMDELDELNPKIKKLEAELGKLRQKHNALYERLERLWRYHRTFKKRGVK